MSFPESLVTRFDYELVVHITQKFVFFDAYLQMIPFAWPVVLTGNLTQNLLSEDIGTLKAAEPQFAGTGIEPVVLVISIGVKNQAGSTRLLVQLDTDGDFVGNFWGSEFGQAQRTASKAFSATLNENATAPLLPPRAE